MSKRILVTGGAGFIGSAVIRCILNTTDFSVVNVDKLTYAGNVENLREVESSNRYFFEKADICSRARLDQIFSYYQPDYVMHLAAESHVDRSIDGPADFIQTNILGTFTLLEVVRDYWSKLPAISRQEFRFHHVSTDEVYGDLPHPKENPEALSVQFTENTPYAPSSTYSASKASSDHLVRAWGRTYGLPTLLSNCSNNYGPYHFPEKLVPITILNALEGAKLPIYGSGDQIRDWLFVEDHARALLRVLTAGSVGETYNIGGNNEKTNIEVVISICDLLQDLMPNTIEYRGLVTFVQDRPGHDRRYSINASKISTELGWQPEESFESGMRKTVVWYLQNLDWCHRAQNGSYQRERLGALKGIKSFK